ncbi:hypothetical protein BDQ17DRAFT_1387682 [Cyathus striatus]|nr:hypothetical protein BDQ17DRAFT_1387682 [Cyathus striatus]
MYAQNPAHHQQVQQQQHQQYYQQQQQYHHQQLQQQYYQQQQLQQQAQQQQAQQGQRPRSDSDTEREQRSASRSDPPHSQTRHHARRHSHHSNSHSHSHNRHQPNHNLNPLILDGRIDNSIETLPDPAPPIPYWSAKRHLTCGNPTPGPPWSAKAVPWRGPAPGKLKTAHAALVLCLNIDVDPPDIIKTNPCAVLECWVDPHTMPSHKALEAIGSNLKHQFEGLSLKISYKPILDPSLQDLKKFCQSMRRAAKDDAVLFYYNGHGVPKPTASGELWCFNANYTQYIPVSLQEVQGWVGSPGVYIWDCSAAGHLLQNFNVFADRRDNEMNMMQGGYPEGVQPMMNSLQLAACAANETLPSCPELPADVFTSCLTSPIDIALRYFIMCHHLPNNITADMVMQLPGDLKDRRTPLGELNWIFTAITDTIAWTTFSKDIFTRLYRCDLLIASLFRNFLLAERIMKNYHCTPHTWPPLPPTNTHPLWATWDLAVDACLRQIPDLLFKNPGAPGSTSAKGGMSVVTTLGAKPGRIGQTNRLDPNAQKGSGTSSASGEKPYQYVPSRFFADQLTAFEVWISRGGSALTRKGPMSLPPGDQRSYSPNGEAPANGSAQHDYGLNGSNPEPHLVPRKPPDQLPIVLQVLLSQPHRLRALILLSQFVDLGPWAVHLVLTIGIFPYISKLLQAAGQDLRPVLIFIWARILAVDPSVQMDLFNNQGYKYFANVLAIKNDDILPNSSEHKAMCSFILASISRDFPHGQMACLNERVFDNCYDRLDEPDFLLRQWTTLCIAQMWDGNDDIKVYVRSAALYALGTFMGAAGSADPNQQGGGGTGTMFHLDERVHFRMEVAVATGATLAIKDDASPMCRKELLVVISCLVKEWRGYFVVCAWLYWEEDRKWRATGQTGGYMQSHFQDEDVTSAAVADWLDKVPEDEMREQSRVLLSSFFTIFVVLLDLSVDPYHEVATNAQTFPFTHLEGSSLGVPPTVPPEKRGSPQIGGGILGGSRVPSIVSTSSSYNLPPPSPMGERPGLNRSDTMTSTISQGVSNTIRRTSSFANALKSLANGIAFPSLDGSDGRSSPGGVVHHDKHKPEIPDVSRPPSPNLNVAQYTSPYSRPPTPQGGSTYSHQYYRQLQNSPPPHYSRDITEGFTACDVIDALIEEDLLRLRARRHPGEKRHYKTASSVNLGLGTGAGIRDVLPLKSTFFDWCCEYFKEPQMRQAEVDEPGSIQYNYQVWRQQRNEKIIQETLSQSAAAETSRWDRPVATLQITGHPLTMAFHSYDPHLVVANESDMITVWDWSQRKRLNYFCNGNPKGTTVTSLSIINQDVGGIILTGSADGIVRLYRNYDPTLEQGPLQMVSAFRGLNEVIQLRQGSGMVMDWKQTAGTLLIGGDSHFIKVWDAQTETQGLDLDTNSESPVTAIVSDQGSSQTFIASFADGMVKIFDRRLEEEDAIVRSYPDHGSWVQNVRWHPTLGGQFLSASLTGQVKLWDIRGSDSAVKTWDMHTGGLAAFDVHPLSGVFAATSAITPANWRTQRTVVQSLSKTNPLSSFNISTGLNTPPTRMLPSPFIPRSSSLVFHPIEMLYALGEPDGTIRVMGCKLP